MSLLEQSYGNSYSFTGFLFSSILGIGSFYDPVKLINITTKCFYSVL